MRVVVLKQLNAVCLSVCLLDTVKRICSTRVSLNSLINKMWQGHFSNLSLTNSWHFQQIMGNVFLGRRDPCDWSVNNDYSWRRESRELSVHWRLSVSLCLSVHMIDPKRLKLQSPNLSQGSWSHHEFWSGYPFNIRSKRQGHKVQKHISDLKAIEWPEWVCTLSNAQRL